MLIFVGGVPDAIAQSSLEIKSQQTLRRSCSDDDSIKTLREWFSFLPAESADAIRDSVIRSAVRSGNRDQLVAAAQRIFLRESVATGRIDYFALNKEMKELRREFRSAVFPSNLQQALEGKIQGSRLYLASALDIAGQQPVESCSRLFKRYLAKQDDRIEFLATYRGNFGRSPYLQQVRPGTEADYPTYILPMGNCQPQPSGPSFFDLLPSGRLAGQYSALGFPEVVQISLRDAPQGTSWQCSGVLLNSHWVLTAGHCVSDGTRKSDNSLTKVYLNSRVAQRRSANGLPTSATLKTSAHVHAGYLQALDANSSPHERGAVDLALLELTHPLGDVISPAKDVATLPEQVLGTLAGYGATKAEPTPNGQDPALDVGWVQIKAGEKLLTWTASLQAVSGPLANASCPGDSGAPIYVPVIGSTSAPERQAVGCIGETRQLIGLVSFGESVNDRSCLASSTGAGPRLLPHHAWICKLTGVYCQ